MQELQFGREREADGALDAVGEILGLACCIEVAIQVGGVVGDVDIAIGRWLPLDEGEGGAE